MLCIGYQVSAVFHDMFIHFPFKSSAGLDEFTPIIEIGSPFCGAAWMDPFFKVYIIFLHLGLKSVCHLDTTLRFFSAFAT